MVALLGVVIEVGKAFIKADYGKYLVEVVEGL